MKKLDIWVVIALTGLCSFGLFNIFGIKRELFGNQMVFSLLGFSSLFLFLKIGTDFFRLNSRIIYSLFIVLLLVTFFFGENIRGSQRWINVFFFNFQPSEFLKPFFVILLADLFASKASLLKKMCLSFVIFIVPFLLILRQPDLGNALIYAGVYVSVLFFSGVSLFFFAVVAIFIILFFPLFWNSLHSYQRERVISFLEPEDYSRNISYNLIQSIITVGSGAFFGRGLGYGTQSRFLFLPEFHTDFAYASLAEQFGFVGGSIVLIFFALLCYRLLLKARQLKNDRFKYLFTVGGCLYILISVFVNIGMNLGLLPVTGIALPFISYGGSSMISNMILVGLLLSL